MKKQTKRMKNEMGAVEAVEVSSLSIKFPDDVRKRVKTMASLKEQSMNEFIVTVLSEKVNKELPKMLEQKLREYRD